MSENSNSDSPQARNSEARVSPVEHHASGKQKRFHVYIAILVTASFAAAPRFHFSSESIFSPPGVIAAQMLMGLIAGGPVVALVVAGRLVLNRFGKRHALVTSNAFELAVVLLCVVSLVSQKQPDGASAYAHHIGKPLPKEAIIERWAYIRGMNEGEAFFQVRLPSAIFNSELKGLGFPIEESDVLVRSEITAAASPRTRIELPQRGELWHASFERSTYRENVYIFWSPEEERAFIRIVWQ